MTEFTWNIVNLDSIVDTGLVTNCAWICRCKNGEFEGSSTLSEIDPSSPDFIPYPNLTEEVVLQWLFSLLGDEKAVVEGVANTVPTEPITAEPTVVTGIPWE